MDNSVARELLETQKQLAIQYLAHTQILCALLNAIDPSTLQFVRQILETQAATGESQGLAAESQRLAVQLVSLATEGAAPPDPKQMLRLIQGAKKP